MNLIRLMVLSVIVLTFGSHLAQASDGPVPGVQLPPWAPYVAGVLYAGLEAWLGKTDKVKSGSVLELVVRGLGWGLKLLSGKPK